MTERVATTCRICAVGCGTIVELDGDRVVSIIGDTEDPWSAGYTCSKGRAGGVFHDHPDRLDRPLVRRDGELVPCSWDEALDDIAMRLQALVADHGPDVVADYTGTGGPLDPSGYALAEAFMRNLGSHQRYSALSIDCPSKFLVPQLMAGVQLQFQPDLARTELLLAVGVNTVVSHGHGVMLPNPLGHLRDLRDRGGRIVVIDPRRSESSHHADLHLAPRPGTDPAILAHLVREALRRGGDGDFLRACADEASLRRLAELVEPYDAERTAEIAGLVVDELRDLDALVAGAGRLSVETGTGATMNRSANLTEWLVWALLAVTGSLDRPGGVTFNPGSLRRFEDAVPGGRGDLGPRPASRPEPAPPGERRDAMRRAGRRDSSRSRQGAPRARRQPGAGDRRPASPARGPCRARRAGRDRRPADRDDGAGDPRPADDRPLRARRPAQRIPPGPAVPALGTRRRRAAR